MTTVNIPDVGDVDFPDTMSQQEIAHAIKTKIIPQFSGNKDASLTKGLIDQISGSRSPSINYSSGPVQFMTGAGDSLQNLVANLANLVPGVKLPLAKRGRGWPYEAGKITGDVGTFAAGGEALDAARFGAEALPYVGKLAQQLGKGGINAVARRALGNAGYGALTNPDDRTQNALTTGGLSAGLDTLFGAFGKLRPSQHFRGELTPEELKENLRVAEGTETNLGEIIGSPRLKKIFENDLATLPFSGIQDSMGRTAKTIRDRGNDLLTQMLGNANPDKKVIQEIAQVELKKAREKALKMKNKLFAESHDLADEIGASVKSKNISEAASDILKEIEGSPRNVSELDESVRQNFLRHRSGKWPDLLKENSEKSSSSSSTDALLESLRTTNPKLHAEVLEALKKKGAAYSDSLRHANAYHGILNTKISKYKNLGDAFLESKYTQLKKAFEQDIKSGISDAGNSKLQGLNDKALSFYENEWVPYKDPMVTAYTEGLGDVDSLISKFVSTGKNDRSHLLRKITDKLPESSRRTLAYGYFKDAIKKKKLNPLKMEALYEKLGEHQRTTLLGHELNKQMEDYSQLVGMNQEPLTLMANPKTGMRTQDVLTLILGHALGGYAGYKADGARGELTGALAGTLAPGLLTRAIVKPYLTSSKTRQKVIEKMLGKKNAKLQSIGNLGKQVLIELINDQFTGKE